MRYLHVSAPIVRNPAAIAAEVMGEPFAGPQFVARRPGHTYNVGRNKAKREKRALRKQRGF